MFDLSISEPIDILESDNEIQVRVKMNALKDMESAWA